MVFFNYKKKKEDNLRGKLYNEKVLFLGWERVIQTIIYTYMDAKKTALEFLPVTQLCLLTV